MTDIETVSIFDAYARLRKPDSFTAEEKAAVAKLPPKSREAFDELLRCATIAERGEAELASANAELTACVKHLLKVETAANTNNPVTFLDCWRASVAARH